MIMGFREGLEAFLVIAVILQYLLKLGQNQLRKNVFWGTATGVGTSLVLGLILKLVADSLGGVSNLAKVWESVASLAALVLVSFFIVWMIRHGSDMAAHARDEVDKHLSGKGLFIVALVIVAREGAEIVLFTFAGKYSLVSIGSGVICSLLLTILVYFSIVKLDLGLIFKVTLAYLILQAGFLVGYGIHEGLSALKGYGALDSSSWLFNKAYNCSQGIFSHKTGWIGVPFHVIFGWYSKPEWIQFLIQYAYTIGMFTYWGLFLKRKNQA